MSRREPALALLSFVGLTAIAGVLGAGAALRGKRRRFALTPKPTNDRFAAAGLGLLALAAVSGWRVWQSAPSPHRTRALALWGTQLALNANWARLFFRRHRARAAMADLVALWATLGAYMLQTRAVDRTASRLMAPYLGWVTFAGYLNEEAIRKHKKFLLN